MSRLPSWTLSARTTGTAWRTRQPIRRGRLATRSTVLCHSVFEFLDPGIRLGQLLFQWQQFSDQRFEHSIFFSKGLQFFIFRHGCTLADFLSFGKSIGADLSSYVYFAKRKSDERAVLPGKTALSSLLHFAKRLLCHFFDNSLYTRTLSSPLRL